MMECIAKDLCNCEKDSNGTRQCPVHSVPTAMSEREKQWLEFSERVSKHLREYTVPQYGDVGDDEITNYSVEDCVTHVSRYAKRYGTQSREGQQELDFVKMAHYTQCGWEKYKNAPQVKVKNEDFTLVSVDNMDIVDVSDHILVGRGLIDGKTIRVYKKRG